MASPTLAAAASGLLCAPPRGSSITFSITPKSNSCDAVGRSASAACGAKPASRQRIAAQPSGEITE